MQSMTAAEEYETEGWQQRCLEQCSCIRGKTILERHDDEAKIAVRERDQGP